MVAFDPKDMTLRRRKEAHPNKAIETTTRKIVDPSKYAVDSAMFLCEEENKKVTDDPYNTEVPLWTATRNEYSRKRCLSQTLINLYWRARKQMAIFEAFALLYMHGCLSAEALALPICYSYLSENVSNVFSMLCCFSKVADINHPPMFNGEDVLQDFNFPVQWLAVMLCRSSHDMLDLNDAIDLLSHSQLLGRLNLSGVQEWNERRIKEVEKTTSEMESGVSGKCKATSKAPVAKEKQTVPRIFTGNAQENAAEKQEHKVFGLLLPSGESTDVRQLFHDANSRFEEIEAVFKEYFGLTDAELAVEDQDEEGA